MTKEAVIDFRDGIGKDKILKITCDNQHIFYDGIAHNSPIMWDDDKEVFTACRVNQGPMQSEYPFETVSVMYDQIQFMHCYDTAATVLDVKKEKGTKLTKEQNDFFMKYINEAAHPYNDIYGYQSYVSKLNNSYITVNNKNK